MKLTPKQIQALRIAVAEVAGVTVIPCTCHEYPWRDAATGKHIPNYPADLNAVRDLVMKMGIVPKRCIAENLEKVCEDDLPGDVWGDAFAVQNATALQRCIALLMTLAPEKWLEIQNLKD